MQTELVTFQSNYPRSWLANQRIYRSGWRNGGQADPWNRAYRWMSCAMARRGIPTHGYSPVWTWSKSSALGGPPTFATADALLSGSERSAGVWIYELSVPAHLVLPSCYLLWNQVLDEFLDGGEPAKSPNQLFDPAIYRYQTAPQPDDVQFCIPFIDRSWVRDVRPLPMRPKLNDWDAAV
ncbi:MAG: hypothetical protein JXQ99_24065 [Hyphomicrobiaceae bacterium]